MGCLLYVCDENVSHKIWTSNVKNLEKAKVEKSKKSSFGHKGMLKSFSDWNLAFFSRSIFKKRINKNPTIFEQKSQNFHKYFKKVQTNLKNCLNKISQHFKTNFNNYVFFFLWGMMSARRASIHAKHALCEDIYMTLQ